MADTDEIQEPEIESSLGSFGKLLITILVFPLQVLFLPMRFLGLFHQSGVPADDYDSYQNLSLGGKLWRSTKKLGRNILMLPYLIVTAPVRFFRGVANSGVREMLFVIPAVLMVGFLGWVGVQVFGRGEKISNRYANEVQSAMEAGDFKLAKTYFTRLMQNEELTKPQMLQWMVVLDQTGEREKAEEILNELAPDDALGYAPAHRLKALQIAFSRKDRDAPLPLEKLKVHLDRSRDHTPMVQQAWSLYYRSIDQPDKAIDALMTAAEVDPSFLIVVAKYQGELNRPEDRLETLRIAELQFTQLLEQKPTSSTIRWMMANTLSQQARFDEAQEILVEGMELNPSNSMRLAKCRVLHGAA